MACLAHIIAQFTILWFGVQILPGYVLSQLLGLEVYLWDLAGCSQAHKNVGVTLGLVLLKQLPGWCGSKSMLR